MADQWYFEWDEKSFGPFSSNQLRKLAMLGRLQPEDIVWKQDRKKGMRADRISNLFPHLLAELPPIALVVAPIADEPASPSKWSTCISGEVSNVESKLPPYIVSATEQLRLDKQMQELG